VLDASLRLEDRAGDRTVVDRAQVRDIRIRRRAPGKTAGLSAAIWLGTLYLFCGDASDGC
jgi:hypothetical protein